MYEPTYLGEIELSEDTLEHYGVKGMKWRNRRNRNSNTGGSQRHIESDYQFYYDPDTKQRYKVLNMDKLMKRGKWAPKEPDQPFSQVLRSAPTRTSTSNRKPRARKRNVTGSGRGAYRKGSGLGYKVGR